MGGLPVPPPLLPAASRGDPKRLPPPLSCRPAQHTPPQPAPRERGLPGSRTCRLLAGLPPGVPPGAALPASDLTMVSRATPRGPCCDRHLRQQHALCLRVCDSKPGFAFIFHPKKKKKKGLSLLLWLKMSEVLQTRLSNFNEAFTEGRLCPSSSGRAGLVLREPWRRRCLEHPVTGGGQLGRPARAHPGQAPSPSPAAPHCVSPGRAPCRPVLPAHCGQTSRPGHLPARFIRPAAQLCLSAVNKYTFSQCSAMKYSPGLS